MITWFDALLVTLLAVTTALGARRGLAGLAWGLGGVAACFVANVLAATPLAAACVALLLGGGLALGTRRLLPAPLGQPWHMGVGALGGLTLGGVLIAALALGFPLDVRMTPSGPQGTYPSANLPPALYDAVRNSALKTSLRGVWGSNAALKTLLIPDQARRL